MTESLFFLFKFLLTNIIFALLLCSSLMRLNKGQGHPTTELFLVSLGLAPALVTLLLYYTYLILPPLSNLFNFLIVTAAYAALLWLGRAELRSIFIEFIDSFRGGWKKIFGNLSSSPGSHPLAFFFKKIEVLLYISLLLVMMIYFILSFIHILQLPVDGNDVLQYAAQGKALFKTKHIEFRGLLLDPETGFYKPSFHAPGFSLFLTWERILNSLFSIESDLLFRSFAFYFGLLILAGQYYYLRSKGKWLALLGTLGLLSSVSFFNAFIHIHIDTYRIFFLLASWIYLARAIEKRDRLSFFLLGSSSGFAAFAHTLGALLAAITLLIFFVFLKGSLLYKVRIASLVSLLALATGGIHYVLDIFWGNGWIFNIHL